MFKESLICGLLFSGLAMAHVDKTDVLNGVNLVSSKKESTRTFNGSVSKLLPFPLELVKKSVTNFSEKCNNSLKDKRRFSSSQNCKYHNEFLVESFELRDIKRPEGKVPAEFYLIGRQVYNRGSYGYYELVEIHKGVNDKGQFTTTVTLKMLNDKEVRSYTKPQFNKESAFSESLSTYTLVEVSPTQTLLTYDYRAETDHWLLNKELAVPQIFASISKSINNLVTTIETESNVQKRALASHK